MIGSGGLGYIETLPGLEFWAAGDVSRGPVGL